MVLSYLVSEITRPVATIEAVSVPKVLSEGGYSDVALSLRVLEQISRIDYEVREESRSKGKKMIFRGADEREMPTFDIPGTSLSVKDVIPWLRTLFHYEPTVVKLVVDIKSNIATVHVKVEKPDGAGV